MLNKQLPPWINKYRNQFHEKNFCRSAFSIPFIQSLFEWIVWLYWITYTISAPIAYTAIFVFITFGCPNKIDSYINFYIFKNKKLPPSPPWAIKITAATTINAKLKNLSILNALTFVFLFHEFIVRAAELETYIPTVYQNEAKWIEFFNRKIIIYTKSLMEIPPLHTG